MRHYFLALILTLCASHVAFAQVPAFPGAEGHGRYSQGGRAADGTTHVYHVTSLEDNANQQGTLRWALKQTGPRTIVFDVSGYIDLNSDLTIPSNTTIAGQTAPFPGITLRYYTTKFSDASQVIVRFIRFRRSQVKDVNDGADAVWGRHGSNIILDHCSFSWSIDELASFYDNRDFTMQWCVLGEALCNAGHDKGPHSYGGIWGGKNASFHHNMITNVQNRCPRLNGARYNWDGYDNTLYANSVMGERVDVRNNLYYNWGTGNGAYGAPGGFHNLVNNYYKAGPGTKNKKRVFQGSANASKDSGNQLPDGLPGRFYISGNYVTAASSPANYDWNGFTQDSGTGVNTNALTYTDSQGLYGSVGATVNIRLDSPIETGLVTTHAAQNAYTKVMAYGGASLYRDEVDARYMNDAENGTTTYQMTETEYTVTNNGTTQTIQVTDFTKGIVDKINDPDGTQQSDRPSFPELVSQSREAGFDSDQDGIPDMWEDTYGLDKTNPQDAMLYTIDTENEWYNNLEVYLNSLVEDIMKAENENALTATDEYYPVLSESQTVPEGGETFTLDNTTQPSPGDGEWTFNNGFKIATTMSLQKANDYLKYNRNQTFTILIPGGMAVDRVTFVGYNNTTDNTNPTSYISELNGVTYSENDYTFPPDKAVVKTYAIPLNAPKTKSVTFGVKGYQTCLRIFLHVVGNSETASQVFLREYAYNYSPTAASDMTVSMQREMGTGYWNTFCVPFDISAEMIEDVLGEGTQVVAFTSFDGSSLHFSDVNNIQAGTPYLVMPTIGQQTYAFYPVEVKNTTAQTVTKGDFSFVGTYVTHLMADDGTEMGLTKSNKLAIPSAANNVMRGLRAYFISASGDTEANVVFNEDETEGVIELSYAAESTEPPVYYNLQGQRVKTPVGTGIYIVNGRKQIIR